MLWSMMAKKLAPSTQISPNIIVAHLLQDWPQATPVFLRNKMNCVGCSLAAFDTLGDALRIYGLPMEPFIAELRRAIQEPPGSSETRSQNLQSTE
jgi:hybrid cluster-associated redox disulfide protein